MGVVQNGCKNVGCTTRMLCKWAVEQEKLTGSNSNINLTMLEGWKIKLTKTKTDI